MFNVCVGGGGGGLKSDSWCDRGVRVGVTLRN